MTLYESLPEGDPQGLKDRERFFDEDMVSAGLALQLVRRDAGYGYPPSPAATPATQSPQLPPSEIATRDPIPSLGNAEEAEVNIDVDSSPRSDDSRETVKPA